MTKPHAIASAHGRFQVFHLEHLDYLRSALDRCDHLIVGITGVTPLTIDPTSTQSPNSDHRTRPENNPLSFYQRAMMVRAALQGDGVDLQRVSVSPFPIERPQLLGEFLPTEIPILTTVREPWNEKKVNLLRELGYTVEVLLEDFDKSLTASSIRDKIRRRDDAWKADVPPAVVECMQNHGMIKAINDRK